MHLIVSTVQRYLMYNGLIESQSSDYFIEGKFEQFVSRNVRCKSIQRSTEIWTILIMTNYLGIVFRTCITP